MSLENLEKRVQALEDLEAIKKLHQRYINLISIVSVNQNTSVF